MTGPERDKILLDLSIRVLAMRDVLAVLLALYAKSSGEPDAKLRQISDALELRLAQSQAPSTVFVQIEQMRAEFDWVLEAARLAVGSP